MKPISYLRAVVAGALALALAACASFPNPVTNNTEATAETAYAAAAELATAYLALPVCAAGSHFSLGNLCKETAIVKSVKQADTIAYTALIELRKFHHDNPGSINEITLVNAAINAAGALKSAIPLKSTKGG